MKISKNTLFKIWLVFVFIFTIMCLSVVHSMVEPNDEIQVCKVEENIAGLPSLNIKEVEKEIEIEKEVKKYEFPFETEDMGEMKVKGATSKELPQRKYPSLKSKEGFTVFTSERVFPEGTLLWIEGVGIRQVQSVITESNEIYVSFDSEESSSGFGEKEVKVFKVIE